MSVLVKICGITNAADAFAAAEAGATLLGFMFFAGSKRQVLFDTAAEIIRVLPPFISKVGVFVNATQDEVLRAIELTGIDRLQFHGDESVEFCSRFGTAKIIKAFRIRDRTSLHLCREYPDQAWLLDSHVEGALGGTGVAFDWDIAVEATKLSGRVVFSPAV